MRKGEGQGGKQGGKEGGKAGGIRERLKAARISWRSRNRTKQRIGYIVISPRVLWP